MIISLCGNQKNKEYVINILKGIYGTKLVICDYYSFSLDTIIENDSKRFLSKNRKISDIFDIFKIIEEERIEFNNYIKEIVNKKINTFLESNKDKIVLLVSNTYLCEDIDKTYFFQKSDLKILVLPVVDDLSLINTYNEEYFDYILNECEKDKIKQIIKDV